MVLTHRFFFFANVTGMHHDGTLTIFFIIVFSIYCILVDSIHSISKCLNSMCPDVSGRTVC